MTDPPNPSRPPEEDPGDIAHYDDATIGRVFRWSLVVVGVLVLGGLGGWFLGQRRSAPSGSPPVALSAPPAPPALQAELPGIRFTDITEDAGIDFVHANGALGEKLLPETMGGGVAFLDFDGDADPDLLFVNGTRWPWTPDAVGPAPTAALYRNIGRGRFQNVTAGSGLDVAIYGMGVAVGDYDNDGAVDVFITAVGGNRLFRNQGDGRFVEVTREAEVGGDPTDWSSCAAWLDFDNDGDLDLFVGNYVRWSREIDIQVGYKLVGIGRAYGPPTDFEGAFSRLYRNEGQGRFADVSAPAGILARNPATGVPLAKPLGVAPIDLDQDGWLDLVIANDTVQNLIFLNQRDGTFREIGAAAGIAFDSYGNARGAMGIDSASFGNDGRIGLAIGNFANEMIGLYVAQQTPTNFADEAITAGIGPASRLLLKFGIFFFDYDLDGWLDLLTANGHLEEDISKIQASQTYAQSAQLFWNAASTGRFGFIAVPPEKAGPDLFQPIVGRGSAYADIDGDGDLDVVLGQSGGSPLLLRNDQQLNHHWLRLKLVGSRGNRDAIGAKVTLTAGGITQTRYVMPTRSYLSQSELPVTFGLGRVDRIDALTITWPGGFTESVVPPALDTLTTLREADDVTATARP